MKSKFYITDVFGKEKYSGNQLATFTDASNISDEEMQKIAFEIGFSETTFITSGLKENRGYDVRIFTPLEEVPFAGHPTLGTSYIIKEHILKEEKDSVILNLKAGQIPVEFKGDIFWMKQNQPDFGNIHSKEELAKVLSINKEDIFEEFPVEEVSTGLNMTIVPLKNMDALKRSKTNVMAYDHYCTHTNARPILLFSPEAYESQQTLSVRMFADCFGIPEDPATGSANGCLAAYLAKHNFLKTGSFEIKTGQGYEMGRPSELELKTIKDGSKIDVYVGGKVIPVAEGEWYL